MESSSSARHPPILCLSFLFGTMDNPAPPRLRPGVHGAFDEESCRMHLHELGDEIVPSYPFAYGIQQIYAILLDEYGTSQIADAISVLHELLEDESCEGNIWRSWRHDWRHRNVSCSSPHSHTASILTQTGGQCLGSIRPDC